MNFRPECSSYCIHTITKSLQRRRSRLFAVPYFSVRSPRSSALLYQRPSWFRDRLDSVHLKTRWLPVREGARSRRSYEKMGDCEQSNSVLARAAFVLGHFENDTHAPVAPDFPISISEWLLFWNESIPSCICLRGTETNYRSLRIMTVFKPDEILVPV